MIVWIFGYGSLMWRPGFDFLERRVAHLEGFRRVLWQGSPDHRGTPQRPGRVATLVRDRTAVCCGIVFATDRAKEDTILAALDEREQGGYDRAHVTVRLDGGDTVRALTYIGAPDNPHFLGAAPAGQMLEQIQASEGPSGHNRDYVLNLAATLRQMNLSDADIEALAAALSGA